MVKELHVLKMKWSVDGLRWALSVSLSLSPSSLFFPSVSYTHTDTHTSAPARRESLASAAFRWIERPMPDSGDLIVKILMLVQLLHLALALLDWSHS